MARHKGCPACRADAAAEHNRKVEAWEARVEAVNAWRESKGREPLEFSLWRYFGYLRGDARVPADDADVCARMFGGRVGWWEKPIGFAAELKAALRRTANAGGLQAKRDRHGNYKPLNYSLPLPSLAASAKRLASGARAAEDLVKEYHAEQQRLEAVNA